MSILLLITVAPTSKVMWHAVRLAQSLQDQQQQVKVFFYQDAVQIANSQMWQPDDQVSLQQAWQALNITLPVCVSAALNRGISDEDNAQRHQLSHANLAQGFELVGLGVLADLVTECEKVIQF